MNKVDKACRDIRNGIMVEPFKLDASDWPRLSDAMEEYFMGAVEIHGLYALELWNDYEREWINLNTTKNEDCYEQGNKV